MKPGIASILAISASIALSACSDPNYAEMCITANASKMPKNAEISITKKTIAKQGLSATVTLSFTAVTKQKDKDNKLSYYKASCIIKGDRIARAFLRPASSG